MEEKRDERTRGREDGRTGGREGGQWIDLALFQCAWPSTTAESTQSQRDPLAATYGVEGAA